MKAPWQSGRSLPQDYYCSAAIFENDCRLIGETQWLLVEHESRISKPGDYFLFNFSRESIVVVRDAEGKLNSFYNVCRHRGSRICLESAGHIKSFVCPYHSWHYGLDGSLRGAPHMPRDFDRANNGLRRCHIAVLDGLIFLNFSSGEPPSFQQFGARIRPFLAPHELERTKIAARMNYPTDANWELVVENFFECYHCRRAHPTYCSVHDATKLLALGAGPGSADPELVKKFQSTLNAWEVQARAKGHVTGMFGDPEDSPYMQTGSRSPIGNGNLTETVDGKPDAPLLGQLCEYDGAKTVCTFNPLSNVMVCNDFAVLFRFTPRSPFVTDMECIWLVHEDAVENRDYRVDNLMRVWDVTLREDKTIIENNQLGVLSSAYVPGVYSLQESRVVKFTNWYMRRFASTSVS